MTEAIYKVVAEDLYIQNYRLKLQIATATEALSEVCKIDDPNVRLTVLNQRLEDIKKIHSNVFHTADGATWLNP